MLGAADTCGRFPSFDLTYKGNLPKNVEIMSMHYKEVLVCTRYET